VSAQRSRKQRLVLIADDDPTMRILVREALEPHGLDVVEVDGGEAALDAFARLEPDVVLLDVQMPGMDGFEVCERIRLHPGGRHTPVMMMTGLDDVESIRRAYEAGATDFVTKPIPWLLLSHRVRYLLRAAENFAELRRSRERLAAAQRLARMGSWTLDFETLHVYPSEEALALYGMAPREGPVAPSELRQRIHPEDLQGLEEAVVACLRGNEGLHHDYRIVLPDGTERLVHAQAQIVADSTGRKLGLEGTVQDVTERRRAEEQIRYLAYHDALTGLGNRLLFKERLGLALAQARRNETGIGILFLDLDHFKRINDTLGHSVGDLLLQGVADRLVASVRDSDTVSRTSSADSAAAISRLGGDEFTILLSDVGDAQDLAKVARRVLDALSRPFSLEGHEIVISGSIGIAAWPMDGDDVDTLLRNADTAIYL
jgi:diguanylate cyclase (GGDEF)-like protein/PAS domain S-box-containing protein